MTRDMGPWHPDCIVSEKRYVFRHIVSEGIPIGPCVSPMSFGMLGTIPEGMGATQGRLEAHRNLSR